MLRLPLLWLFVFMLSGLASAQTHRVETVLFVGNSITHHAPSASLGWTGNWGMAATSEANDYVHRLVARIAAQQGTTPAILVHASGGGTLAGKLAQSATLSTMHADLIIVQMGENDSQVTVAGFQQPYDELVSLLRAANPDAHIICTGAWKSSSKTAYIMAVCAKYGLPYANISQVWPDPANSAASTGLWTNAGVGWHPSDSGMEGYANAIWNAFDFTLPNTTPPPVNAPVYPVVNDTNFASGVYTDANPTALPYRYFRPKDYSPADTVTKYPLVVFLHGSGQRGTDNFKQLSSNASSAMIFLSGATPDNQTLYPCFWVAPQCQQGWHDPAYVADQLQGLVDHFLATYPIDPDRVYLTGVSMGADGVTHQLARFPARWAAAHASAGWSNGDEAAYKHVPFWVFHTADDTTVPVAGSDNLVANLRAAGGDPIYTRYNVGGHGTAWGRAYNPLTPLVPWMMSQRRGRPVAKTAGPYVQITSPTATPDHAVAASSITLAGSAESPSLNTLTWKKGAASGSVSGTSTWTSPSIPLSAGSNVIQIFAKGVAHAYLLNGSTSFSDTITVLSVAPTSYSAWQTSQTWDGQDNTPDADADADGLSNLEEYALGSSPLSATDAALRHRRRPPHRRRRRHRAYAYLRQTGLPRRSHLPRASLGGSGKLDRSARHPRKSGRPDRDLGRLHRA